MFKDSVDSKALLMLSADVIAKAGLTHIQSSDCRWLSYDIQRVTGHHISETTLKRFFGFAASKYHLSSFTKNSLSNYLGFADWDAYVSQNLNTGEEHQRGDYWKDLRKKALRISRYTYQALKNRSGIPYEYTIHRAFAEEHLRYFLDSDFLATSFIAPGGYGKSILMTRLVEKLWLKGDAEFENDIVWFVSGQTIGGLLNMGFDLDNWFMHQVGLIEQENIHEYFANNPGEIRGRLIMILDGFDEIIHKDEEIQAFFAKILDFVTVNQEYKWIKIVLSVRSYTWEYVAEQINSSNYIRKHWYLGPTFSNSSLINVPLLSESEILEILGNLFGPNFSALGLNKEMLQQLSNPFYVQLLFQLRMISTEKGADKGKFNYFDLISEFIMVKIYQTRFSTEKISIIKRFLEHTGLGSEKDFVEKDKLVSEQGDLKKAYHELISYGVLVEENLSNVFFFKKVVYFNHVNLLEYFIAMEILTNHRHEISSDLFLAIDRQYANSRYKIPLLKWLIYYALEGNQLKGLAVLKDLQISTSEKEKLIIFLAGQFKKKFIDSEQNAASEEVLRQRHYFSEFIISGFNSTVYEQSLEIFFALTKNNSEKIALAVSIANIALLNLNSKKILEQLRYLKYLTPENTTDFLIDPAELLTFIYEYYTGGSVYPEVINKLMQFIDRNSDQVKMIDPSYRRISCSLVMTILDIGGSPDDFFFAMNKIYPNRRLAFLSIRSSPYLFVTLFQLASAILKLKDIHTPRRIASFFLNFQEKLPFSEFNAYYSYFYEALMASIALEEGRLKEAVEKQKAVVEFCEKGSFSYLRLLSERNLIEFYKKTGKEQESKNLIQQLESEVILNEFDLYRITSSLGPSSYVQAMLPLILKK